MLQPAMWIVIPFALTCFERIRLSAVEKRPVDRDFGVELTSPTLQVIARCFKGCFNPVLSLFFRFEASTSAAEAEVSAPFARDAGAC